MCRVEFNEDLGDFNETDGGFLMFNFNFMFCTCFAQCKMYRCVFMKEKTV